MRIVARRTELAMSIFGRSYGQGISGKVFLHGKETDVSSIQKAIKGLVLLAAVCVDVYNKNK